MCCNRWCSLLLLLTSTWSLKSRLLGWILGVYLTFEGNIRFFNSDLAAFSNRWELALWHARCHFINVCFFRWSNFESFLLDIVQYFSKSCLLLIELLYFTIIIHLVSFRLSVQVLWRVFKFNLVSRCYFWKILGSLLLDFFMWMSL